MHFAFYSNYEFVILDASKGYLAHTGLFCHVTVKNSLRGSIEFNNATNM